MNKRYLFVLMTTFILLPAVIAGCSSTPVPSPPKGTEVTCIQGTVWYSNPADGKKVPYPQVTVAAWVHGTNDPIIDTKTDGSGNYCVEVPLGDFSVDLRVWGLQRISRTDYTCKGSANNINLGKTSIRCGGDCINVDIVTECKEFRPVRRSK